MVSRCFSILNIFSAFSGSRNLTGHIGTSEYSTILPRPIRVPENVLPELVWRRGGSALTILVRISWGLQDDLLLSVAVILSIFNWGWKKLTIHSNYCWVIEVQKVYITFRGIGFSTPPSWTTRFFYQYVSSVLRRAIVTKWSMYWNSMEVS